MKSVAKRFADELEPGEQFLTFDVGRSRAGRAQLVVTDRAAILIASVGPERIESRMPFESLSKVWTNAEGTLVSLVSKSGTDLMLEFDRPRRPLVGAVLTDAWAKRTGGLT